MLLPRRSIQYHLLAVVLVTTLVIPSFCSIIERRRGSYNGLGTSAVGFDGFQVGRDDGRLKGDASDSALHLVHEDNFELEQTEPQAEAFKLMHILDSASSSPSSNNDDSQAPKQLFRRGRGLSTKAPKYDDFNEFDKDVYSPLTQIGEVDCTTDENSPGINETYEVIESFEKNMTGLSCDTNGKGCRQHWPESKRHPKPEAGIYTCGHHSTEGTIECADQVVFLKAILEKCSNNRTGKVAGRVNYLYYQYRKSAPPMANQRVELRGPISSSSASRSLRASGGTVILCLLSFFSFFLAAGL